MLFGGLLAERMVYGYAPGERGHKGDHQAAAALLAPLPHHERIRLQSEAMNAAAQALRGRWELVCAIAGELRAGRSLPRAAR